MPFEPRRPTALARPALAEPSSARRYLQRTMPESWRFAHQMAVDLVRQVEFLAWVGRADAIDTYFLRQAEAMLRPKGLTDLIGGGEDPPAPAARRDLDERVTRFSAWSGAIVTAVLLDLDERREVTNPHQAATYLVSGHLRFARAAAAWGGKGGMASVRDTLCELPGYALVLLAGSPNDTVERFIARDAFWQAVANRT